MYIQTIVHSQVAAYITPPITSGSVQLNSTGTQPWTDRWCMVAKRLDGSRWN